MFINVVVVQLMLLWPCLCCIVLFLLIVCLIEDDQFGRDTRVNPFHVVARRAVVRAMPFVSTLALYSSS